MGKLYRQVNVWVRLRDRRIAVYRCFEILPDRTYCVQSKDFFDLPVDPERARQSELQFLHLLAEDAPDVRSEAFSTLEEAIQRFDASFDE